MDAATLAAVERVLAARFGGPVRLSLGPQTLSGGSEDRSHVWRCLVLAGAPAGAPASVIVKGVIVKGVEGYDARDAAWNSPAWRLFNDWAGGQFLSGLASHESLTPVFLGGDKTSGVIVLEDLLEDLGAAPNGETLADVLLGNDATRAENGLVVLARTLGRVHAATAGRAADFARLRNRLAPFDRPDATYLGLPVGDALRTLPEAFAAAPFGLAPPPGLDAEIARITGTLQNPGPFLVYTHGDPCPANAYLSADGRLRLLDWEFGAFRHALLDGVYGRVPFATCSFLGRLPAALPARMEAAYRTELARCGVPEAGDDTIFFHAAACACAFWTLAYWPAWHLSEVVAHDVQWGRTTIRQRLVHRLETLAGTLGSLQHLPAVAAFARAAGERLRARWAGEGLADLPLYPAFRARSGEKNDA